MQLPEGHTTYGYGSKISRNRRASGLVPGVGAGRRLAFFAAWFLALAGLLNGVAHPAFAVGVGGYFPGLVTSPFIGAAGIWLWLRLRQTT